AAISNIELVSRAPVPQAVPAQGFSRGAVPSPDGRFVLFSSSAPDIFPGASVGQFNLYLLDTTNDTIELISVAVDGAPANGESTAGGMSRDNRYVVFESAASNLAVGDTNGNADIFLRDRVAGTTTLISHSTNGVCGNGPSRYPKISDHGKTVVFQSE